MNAWKTGIRIVFFLTLSLFINWIASLLKSDYPAKFLEDKIVEILLTLMAINVATAGIIVSKLDEMSRTFKMDFSPTITEVKRSIVYQIWLVAISGICLILFNSAVIKGLFADSYKYFFDTLLLTIFIAAIDILRDTGLAIFVINDSNPNNKKQ